MKKNTTCSDDCAKKIIEETKKNLGAQVFYKPSKFLEELARVYEKQRHRDKQLEE